MRVFCISVLGIAISHSLFSQQTTDSTTVATDIRVRLGKNLNVDHFANGDPIPETRTAEEWKQAGENKQPAWCYYNNDTAFCAYGKLYNWYAVIDPRGLAPRGWHVPSEKEWNQIVSHRGGNAPVGVMRGGSRSRNGAFRGLKYYGYWWSSSERSTKKAWGRYLGSLVDNKADPFCYNKNAGLSVRCVRD